MQKSNLRPSPLSYFGFDTEPFLLPNPFKATPAPHKPSFPATTMSTSIEQDLTCSDAVQKAVVMLMERTSALEDRISALTADRDAALKTLQSVAADVTQTAVWYAPDTGMSLEQFRDRVGTVATEIGKRFRKPFFDRLEVASIGVCGNPRYAPPGPRTSHVLRATCYGDDQDADQTAWLELLRGLRQVVPRMTRYGAISMHGRVVTNAFDALMTGSVDGGVVWDAEWDAEQGMVKWFEAMASWACPLSSDDEDEDEEDEEEAEVDDEEREQIQQAHELVDRTKAKARMPCIRVMADDEEDDEGESEI